MEQQGAAEAGAGAGADGEMPAGLGLTPAEFKQKLSTMSPEPAIS